MKRAISVLMAVIMLCNLLPTNVFAAGYQVSITDISYVSGSGLKVYWDPESNAADIYFQIVVKVGSTVVYNNDPDEPVGCSGGLKKRTASYEQYILIPDSVLVPGETHKVWIKGFAANDVGSTVVTEGGDDTYTVPTNEYLTVLEPEDLEFVDVDATGEEYLKIELEVSGKWTASCSADWVSLSRTSGDAINNVFYAKVDANDEDAGTERDTYIKIKCGDLSEKVYIYQNGREMTDAEKVGAEKTALEIGFASGDDEDSVTENISLPSKGIYGSTILWESSDPSVISAAGAVTRPSEDTEVTLTATLINANAIAEKKFYLTVLADDTQIGTEPQVTSVIWNPATIIEDALINYTVLANAMTEEVHISVDSNLLAVVDSYTVSGNERAFSAEFAIQNPGTRTLEVVAYNGTVVSVPYNVQITVEDAELEQLDPVVIIAPENDEVLTEGESLWLEWETPDNVTEVDRYIVKVWSDSENAYSFTDETQSTSITVPSSVLKECGGSAY